jgi:hypothetical protein
MSLDWKPWRQLHGTFNFVSIRGRSGTVEKSPEWPMEGMSECWCQPPKLPNCVKTGSGLTHGMGSSSVCAKWAKRGLYDPAEQDQPFCVASWWSARWAVSVGNPSRTLLAWGDECAKRRPRADSEFCAPVPVDPSEDLGTAAPGWQLS